MAADPSIVKQAREWIDRVDAGRGLSNSWRLQIIQKRYRKRDVPSDTGTALECDGESCVGLPMRIRRFVPGCPWALVDQAIRYLVCKAPYEGSSTTVSRSLAVTARLSRCGSAMSSPR